MTNTFATIANIRNLVADIETKLGRELYFQEGSTLYGRAFRLFAQEGSRVDDLNGICEELELDNGYIGNTKAEAWTKLHEIKRGL